MTNVITPRDIDIEYGREVEDYLDHADNDPLAQFAIEQAGWSAFGDEKDFEDGPDVGALPIPVAKRN